MILSHPHIPCYFFFPLPNFPILSSIYFLLLSVLLFFHQSSSSILSFTHVSSGSLQRWWWRRSYLYLMSSASVSLLRMVLWLHFTDSVFNLAQTHTHTQARMQELQQYNERPFMTSKYPRQAGAPARHHGNSSFNWFGCSTGACECWLKKKCWFKLQESHWGYFNHCVIMFLWECFCSCNLYKFCVMLFSMLGNKSKANNPLSPLFVQVIRGIPLGVGQIFACGDLGPSLLILGAVFLYSPLLAVHALLGSAVGTLTGWFQSVCSCGCVGGVGERKVLLHLFVHHTNAPLTINPNLTQSSVILGSTCQHFMVWYITLELTTYRELLNFTGKCEEVSITVWT